MTQFVFLISFLMAFLLFAVQPMATKMVLPTLGGTPAVWNTAMLTFQMLLLAGYGYVHLLTTHFTPRMQRLIHGALFLISLVVLPLTVTLQTNDALFQNPIYYLTLAFLLHLGVPFFALSATAPLLQSWVSRSDHPLSRKPYVLYSASNLGSLLALIGYVVVVEPFFSLSQQSIGWSVLYVAGAASLMIAGFKLRPGLHVTTPHMQEAAGSRETTWPLMLLWVFLAFLSSALCLAVTSFITTDIAAVPLLWIMPFSLYLLSFIDAFSSRPLAIRIAMRISPLFGVAALILYAMQYLNMLLQFLFHVLAFGVMAFGLNGWLAHLRPRAEQLTRFYFCLAIGGALGGVLNALVAPLAFTNIIEYPVTLLVASLTLFLLWQKGHDDKDFTFRKHLFMMASVVAVMAVFALNIYLVGSRVMYDDWRPPWVRTDYQMLLRAACAAALITLALQRRYANAFYGCIIVCAVILFTVDRKNEMKTILKERNFFGVVRVDLDATRRLLFHNTTMHSFQLLQDRIPPSRTTYYANLGDVFNLPEVRRHPFAVIGLGAGTMKCYTEQEQLADFFEINPVMVKIAEGPGYFTFLRDCPGGHRVFLGDGRIMVSRQPDGQYGLIGIDAFSSDAIPAHLLTTEAIRMYFTKLTPHGVLLVHTTNRYLRLWPLMAAQAKALNLVAYGRGFGHSTWVVLARSEADVAQLIDSDIKWEPLKDGADHRPWTDHYSNLLPYFIMDYWPKTWFF